MNFISGIVTCFCITVGVSMAIASDNANVTRRAVAISSHGYPAAVAVAGPFGSSATAVAVAGAVNDYDTVVEKSSTDTVTSSGKPKTEEKSKDPKNEFKPVKSRGVSAIAVAGSGSSAAAIASPGSGATYHVSSGKGRAMAATTEGGFIGVSSVAGKKPRVYTSQDAMSQDMDSESYPELGILQKLLDLFGW